MSTDKSGGHIDVDGAKRSTEKMIADAEETKARAKRAAHVMDLRNLIAAARAWGDVAGRDSLYYGVPSIPTVKTVIAAWQEVLEYIEKGN